VRYCAAPSMQASISSTPATITRRAPVRRSDANARGYSRQHTIEAARNSRRLRIDYIELYQTHIWDAAAHLEEMVEAFDHLVRAGKVLYVGITDMPFRQFATAYFYAERHGLSRVLAMSPRIL
jgi:1-deoxyxylulose-5-phosphate synthase